MVGRRASWVLVFLIAAGAASAMAAPPPIRQVQPNRSAGDSHEVRVCHLRLVRRRDQSRHWHNARIKVCHTERVRR
jgi:hypothetical protein